MKRCVAYCRVSTNSKDQENSFENQRSYFEREIGKNEHYQFTGIYADKGISGTKLNRPEFDRMIYDAGLDIVEVKNADADNRKTMKKYITMPSSTRKPKYDLILVKNTARFARNVLVEEILRDLARVGVYVKFLDLGKSTENQQDIIFLQMFQIFDEGESRKKSQAVIFGHEEGANRGIINPGHNLYGYIYLRDENRLEVNQEEAEIVKTIFELYAAGEGVRRIINHLSANGIKTREGNAFSPSTIKRILKNEKYIGVNVRRKYDTGTVFSKNSYPKVKPRNEWIDTGKSDKIPPIVEDDIFNSCQELFHGKKNHENQRGIYKGVTKYAGQLVCGLCGSSYISNMDRGRRFYNCSKKKAKGTDACNNKNISVKTLGDILLPDVFGQARHDAIEMGKSMLLKSKEEYIDRLMSTPEEKIRELELRLADVKDQALRLANAYTKKLISEDELAELKPSIDEERQRLEQELKSYTMPKEELLAKLAEIDLAVERVNSMEKERELTEEEMLADIEKIIVMPENTVDVVFKFHVDEQKVRINDIVVKLRYE